MNSVVGAGNNANATANTGGYNFTGANGNTFGGIGSISGSDTSLPSIQTGIQGQSVWNPSIAADTKSRTTGLTQAIKNALGGTNAANAGAVEDWAQQLGDKAYQSAERKGTLGEAQNQLDIGTAKSAGYLGAANKLLDYYNTLFNQQSNQQSYLTKMMAKLAGFDPSNA
jgi:hypothetical protein